MDETTPNLLFWGGVFLSLLLGGLAGWWRGLMFGAGNVCVVIGRGAVGAVGLLGSTRWQFVCERDEGW